MAIGFSRSWQAWSSDHRRGAGRCLGRLFNRRFFPARRFDLLCVNAQVFAGGAVFRKGRVKCRSAERKPFNLPQTPTRPKIAMAKPLIPIANRIPRSSPPTFFFISQSPPL